MTPFALPSDHAARMERVRLSLDGLSVGDAFGQHFFITTPEPLIANRVIPRPRWHYTDDTEMALAIVEVLEQHGHIHQDELAQTFGRRYLRNPMRGYGGTAHSILQALGEGQSWHTVSPAVFNGQGSMGNGGAMRVAPLGAYFAEEDFSRVVQEARASAEVTHGHPEGQAGAIAVAVAAAWAWRVGAGRHRHAPGQLLELAIEHTPLGETHSGLERALTVSRDVSAFSAATWLGSGYLVTSPDTVPFSLWCADRHLDNYTEAMWTTVAGLGDRDTTCAIVGGIVALAAGRGSIPAEWLRARESLGFASSDPE